MGQLSLSDWEPPLGQYLAGRLHHIGGGGSQFDGKNAAGMVLIFFNADEFPFADSEAV